ncbi:MEDS domain-containing protein [Actinocorallia populi]|uniref:MEDS domain-containing protein n=1 Tax=Actinocorallia populi TaxID=2079200 RepID=UPI0018E56C50|nr:MEDS domain-containing protein [Actinocorallia populi]
MTQRMNRELPAEKVGHGDHLCLVFGDDAEKRRVATRYMTDGLALGERILYFTDQSSPEAVRGWLHAARVDVGEACARGRLQVVAARDSYLASGRFDPDAMIQTLYDEVRRSLDDGHTGLRVTGEMGWALRGMPGAELLPEYEKMITEVFAGNPASAVCHYDARLFGPDELAVFDHCHPLKVELTPLHGHGALRIVPAFQDGRRALRVIGSVDLQTTDLLAEALRTARSWPGDIRVDMSALEFIDLTGLRLLARTADSLGDGRILKVEHLPEMLRKVIRLAGLDRSPAFVVSPSGEVPPS